MPGFFRDYTFKFLYHLKDRDLSDFNSQAKIEALLSKHLVSFEETYFAIDAENPCPPLDAEEKKKALALIENALLKYDESRQEVEQKLTKRPFAKLDKTVSNILLLGTTELLQKEQPFKTIINEYILLAKKYGQKDSFTLINGVLDAIAKRP